MKPILLTLALSCSADAASTHVALGQAAVREGNPILPSQPWAIDAVMAASTVSLVAGLREFRKAHPRWAWVVAGVVAGVHTVAAIHNVRVIRQQERR